MLAINSQMYATSVTFMCIQLWISWGALANQENTINLGLVLILSPTGCVYFPQSCRNTHLPHFLDCLLNTTLIPCLLVFFLSILHERVCDYSEYTAHGRYEYSYSWLTHVRTGPQKKNRDPTLAYFGRTFDLVAGWQCICACAVPHPLCT